MSTGRVKQIYLFPERLGPARVVDEVEAVAGRGLEGDQQRGKKRALTLLSQEAWDAAMAELGADLPPVLRRANLLLSGLDLAGLVERHLRIGAAEVWVRGETTPCGVMDQQYEGLQQALKPDMRGGVYGSVVGNGMIRVGDVVVVCGTD